MVVAGIVLKNISAEKHGPAKGKLSVHNNALIKDVEKAELNMGAAKRPAARFSFEYVSKYEPKVATLSLTGTALWVGEKKDIDQLLEGWKKDKKLPDDVTAAVLNAVFAKCSITGLLVSREMNLPAPIQLPRIRTPAQDK